MGSETSRDSPDSLIEQRACHDLSKEGPSSRRIRNPKKNFSQGQKKNLGPPQSRPRRSAASRLRTELMHSRRPSRGSGKGQRSRRRAATTSLIVRVRSALASLLPGDTTFRSHMASCLDTIRAKTEAPTPGRRPGYKAKRYNYLDALPKSHPRRPSRLEVYEALDALLKAVWPQPLSSAEKTRRWRAKQVVDFKDDEVEVEQAEAEAEAMSEDEVEEVAPPLQSSAAAAASLAAGDVQISTASGAPKPPPS